MGSIIRSRAMLPTSLKDQLIPTNTTSVQSQLHQPSSLLLSPSPHAMGHFQSTLDTAHTFLWSHKSLTIEILFCFVLVTTAYVQRRLRNGRQKDNATQSHVGCPFMEIQEPEYDISSRPGLSEKPPYFMPPLRPKGPKINMDVARLDFDNWLTIDEETTYIEEHKVRAQMLTTRRDEVYQALPESLSDAQEALDLVVEFMTARFPQWFSVSGSPGTPSHRVHNHLVHESHSLYKVADPVELASRLAMEDFNILKKNPNTGQFCLTASATLYPAGWKLSQLIGGTMSDLHGAVPNWDASVGCPVDHYFNRMASRRRGSMERKSLFIQCDDKFFKDISIVANATCSTAKCELYARRERQVFRPLSSGAILFSVHTFMQRVEDMTDEEIEVLVQTAENYEVQGMELYKGSQKWLPIAREIRQARTDARNTRSAALDATAEEANVDV